MPYWKVHTVASSVHFLCSSCARVPTVLGSSRSFLAVFCSRFALLRSSTSDCVRGGSCPTQNPHVHFNHCLWQRVSCHGPVLNANPCTINWFLNYVGFFLFVFSVCRCSKEIKLSQIKPSNLCWLNYHCVNHSFLKEFAHKFNCDKSERPPFRIIFFFHFLLVGCYKGGNVTLEAQQLMMRPSGFASEDLPPAASRLQTRQPHQDRRHKLGLMRL